MQQNKSFIKLALTLVIGIALAGCNGGNNTTTNNTVVTSSLQAYINSLAYTPAKTKQLTTSGGTKQQSFTTPGGLTINSVDIKFYSGESCTGTLVQTQTLNSDLTHPVTPTAGTYSSTSASNNALCGNYQNGANNGCSVLYADMSAGRMRSMQYTYNLDNGAGGSIPVVAGCMYNANAVVTMGEDSTTGVEGIANWTDQTTSVACSGGTCGFSQAYNVTLSYPAASLSGAIDSNTFKSGSGTVGSAFSVIQGTTPYPTVTYTILNSSVAPANNFYVNWVQPNGWSTTVNNCGEAGSRITVPGNGGSCSIVFDLDTTESAEYNLDLSSITMYWTNTGSAVEQSEQLSGIIYAKVVPVPKMIFISVTGTTGAMGGLAGADAICQSDANAGSKTSVRSATWKALLRGNNATSIGTTYATSMGDIIAKATTTNLIAVNATNNTLQHAIDRNNNGELVSQLAWTGGSGTAQMDNCKNWTKGVDTFYGSYGASNSTTIWWSDANKQLCDSTMSLYCVQQ